MQKLFLAVSLAATIATPVFAQSPQADFYNSPYVISGGQIIGQDPDPNVRLELRRNSTCYLHGCASGGDGGGGGGPS
jgi:hypothetical protein